MSLNIPKTTQYAAGMVAVLCGAFVVTLWLLAGNRPLVAIGVLALLTVLTIFWRDEKTKEEGA